MSFFVINKTKIVINACYGGFNLSNDAVCRYLELSGISYTIQETPNTFGNGINVSIMVNEKSYYFDSNDYQKRSDPFLVQVVEELGKKASGSCSRLVIKEIIKGKRCRIIEYDGHENIEIEDDIKWLTA